MRLRFALLASILLLLACWWAYAPGLSGGFLFDDFNNLDQLGLYGRVDNARSLLLYLTSGSADPIGRPLSMLSFLLDARDWPADPAPFKRTNVLLHLLNGALLGLLLSRLGRRLALPPPRAHAAALLGAALWLLHPLLVSTTLYVVQREAMLPATFALLGLLAWLHGGERLGTAPRRGTLWMLAGAWGCTALATLCKANGVLLPLLLLTLEWALPPSPHASTVDTAPGKLFRTTRAVLLAPPCLLLTGWLLARLPAVFSGETFGRPWNLGQRLLSEPRALCDYLALLWAPQANGSSVFSDDFRASADWRHPWTTLPALAAVLALAGLALAARRRQPALAFAIAFYFAGQLLESTVVPLELYFEHRNYLPALPMFWPLALWLTGPGSLKVVRQALTFALLLLLTLLCHARAAVWGRPYEQALLLATTNVNSPRAQANAAAYEMSHGRPDLAARRLARVSREMPEEAQIALNWVAADCAMGQLSADARDAAHHALLNDRSSSVLVENWLSGAVQTASHKQCRGLDLDEVGTMLRISQDNPHYGTGGVHYAEFQGLVGQLELAYGNGPAALQAFNSGLAAFPTPDRALLQAAQLGSANFPALGLAHLQYSRTLTMEARGQGGMPLVHFWLLEKLGYWSNEFTRMQGQLEKDTEEAAMRKPAGSAPQ